MPTIQDLEFADLRVVRGDDGRITSIIDTGGRDVGLVTTKVNPLTGEVEFTAGGEVVEVGGGSVVSITGSSTIASVLTAALASGWTATGYQWRRDGGAISGATSTTYTVTGSDAGKVLSVTATGLSNASTGMTIPAATGFTTSDNYYFASNRLKEPTGTLPITANNHILVRLYLGTAPFDSHSYRFAMPSHNNSVLGTWPTESPMAVDMTIQGVAIGYSATKNPTTATFVAGTIGGSASAVMLASNTVGLITDDIISVGSPIPANSHRWLQLAFTVTASSSIPASYLFASSDTLEGTARAASAYSATSTMAINNSQMYPAYGPSFVVCKGHNGRLVGLTVGDSIATNLNEQADSYSDGISGFMMRGFEGAVKKTFSANIAIPGSGPMQWTYNYPATRSGSFGNKFDLIKLVSALQGGVHPFTHIFSEHSTNSVNGLSANSVGTNATTIATTTAASNDTITGLPWNTPSGFLAGMKAYADILKTEFPGIPLVQTTCITKGSTTDGFTSTTNYTPNPSTIAQAFAFNASLRADLAGGKFDAYIDVEPAAGAPGDPTKLKVHPFASTLASAYTNGLTPDNVVLTSVDGLQVGDGVVIDPNGGSRTGSTAGSYVVAINTSTKTVTLAGGRAYAAAAGAVIKGQHMRDGTHPNTSLHKLMAAPVSAGVDALNAAIA